MTLSFIGYTWQHTFTMWCIELTCKTSETFAICILRHNVYFHLRSRSVMQCDRGEIISYDINGISAIIDNSPISELSLVQRRNFSVRSLYRIFGETFDIRNAIINLYERCIRTLLQTIRVSCSFIRYTLFTKFIDYIIFYITYLQSLHGKFKMAQWNINKECCQ